MDKHLIIIPNTLAPYGFEIVNVLAYPDGFEYRFRFDEKWVHNSTDTKNIVGKDGVIILREFETSLLFPIRYFTVKKFAKIGKIFYIEVILCRLVAIESETIHTNKQLEQFRQSFMSFNSSIIKENAPRSDMRPLVFLTNYECNLRNEHRRSDLDEEMESWGNILACLKDVNFFNNVQFLRLIGAEQIGSTTVKIGFENGGVTLSEGKDYKIQIAQFIPKNDPARPLSKSDILIKSDDRTITILRGAQRAVGRYDVLTFIIRVNNANYSGASFLDIKQAAISNVIEDAEPHLYIPVRIVRSYRRRTLHILLSVFFFVIYILPNVTGFFNDILPKVVIDTVKDFSVIGLSVTLMDILAEIRRSRL